MKKSLQAERIFSLLHSQYQSLTLTSYMRLVKSLLFTGVSQWILILSFTLYLLMSLSVHA